MALSNMLREIALLAPKKDQDAFIDEKANHAYESVRKLFVLIEETYEKDVSDELIKRFINAVRTDDYRKFKRGIKKLKKEEPS